MRWLLLILSLAALAGCVVDVEGAACDTDENCPTGQFCNAGSCRFGSAPADAGTGDGGTSDAGSNCPATACTVGTDARCSEDRLGVVACVADTNGCGFFPADGGVTPCDAPRVCVAAATSAACECPQPGPAAGDGCSTQGERSCAGQALLHCASLNGCLVWQQAADCGADTLNCGDGPTGLKQCLCPTFNEQTLHANPVRGGDLDGFYAVNGHDTIEACQFRRLTDALSRAQAMPGNLAVTAHGFPAYSTWEAGAAYAVGDRVMPTSRNFFVYEATTAGTSAGAQPTWPSERDATVTDGTVTWRNVGPDFAAFTDETFPLVIPSNRIVSGECDTLSDGGTDCDPSEYGIVFGGDGASGAMQAVRLSAGATLGSIFVAPGDGPTGATAVTCNTGKVTVAGVGVLGDTDTGSRFDRGFEVVGDCELTAVNLAAFRVNGTALHVNSTSTGKSTAYLGTIGYVDQDTLLPNTRGIEVRGGNLDVAGMVIAGSVAEGVVVDSASSTVILADVIVAGNGASLVPVNAASGIKVSNGNVTILGGDVAFNGRSGLEVGGGTVLVGPSMSSVTADFTNNATSSNASEAAGIEVANGFLGADAVVLKDNRGAGLSVRGGTAFLQSASSITGNGAGGSRPGVAVSGGTVSITGTNAARIAISGNTGGGVQVTNGNLTLTYVNANSNTAGTSSGVLVTGGSVTVNDSNLALNAEHGAALGGGTLQLNRCEIANNSKNGILVSPTVMVNRTLTVDSSLIHSNGFQGLLVAPMSNPTVSITRSKFYKNAAQVPVGMGPAGVAFNSPATLSQFTQNELYANKGRQLSFGAAGNWNISSATCASTTQPPNAIYCYDFNPLAMKPVPGLFAAPGANVTALNVSWQSNPALVNQDWEGGGTVVGSPSCSPSPQSCP